MRFLTSVTVSVNYSDFLVHTIEANKNLIDRWIIVTDNEDYKTKELCEANNIECIQTDVFYTHGIFNKYAGINEALKRVDRNEWVLFLDSDIILPKDMRRVLDNLEIKKNCIYGIDRLNCEGFERWEEFKKSDGTLKEYWLLHPAGLPLGARLVHLYGVEGDNGKFGGYNPLGFFQLCHKSQFIEYPYDTLGADHCDLVFAKLWHRSKRHLIPEMFAIHLESMHGRKGVNWYGRKSSPFERAVEKVSRTIEEVEENIIEAVEKAVDKVEDFIEDIFKKGCPPHQPY